MVVSGILDNGEENTGGGCDSGLNKKKQYYDLASHPTFLLNATDLQRQRPRLELPDPG